MSILLILAGLFAGGCGEYITFSKDSRAKGVQYLQTNQYDEARGAFRDAVRQNPRDYRSYHYLGAIYEREHNYSTAIAHYKTSLAVQNVTLEGQEDLEFKRSTFASLARALSESDARDLEINKLEADAQNSKTGDEYFALAKTFALRGDADSAIDAYNKAHTQAPNTFYIVKDEGLYLEQIGHKPLAEAALRRAFRLNDKDVEVNTALRRLGIIPGPALKEEGELKQPLIPKGPIPDYINDRKTQPVPSVAPGKNPAD